MLRKVTERKEGVEAGTHKLVGMEADDIVREASRLLDDRTAYDAMATRANPLWGRHRQPQDRGPHPGRVRPAGMSQPPATPPLVSIVLPTYKRAPLLAQAMRSVLAQTHGTWNSSSWMTTPPTRWPRWWPASMTRRCAT